ncbi:RTA1 like protein [Eremomyces bilateralis CBS 781.70]|uniref:RTA1 like protein n=1 Tax=Eremomyces bilateralis CBS 781.70 TaxID=1392243 RepID=A0A6G1FXU4_9PEZI|nr:RTA1 like protein [Eremomyces bilateralis CBS 781.70]KAF1810613.1 RTA1 like protein [Eremomyces bilateralis CBS 781.70]
MAEGRPPIGYIDPNFPNPNTPDDARIIIYGYTPSFVLAILAIVLFAISAIAHGFQLRRYKTWYFTPMCVGTIMEIVGYAARMLSSRRSPYNVKYFVIQYFFIVTAPVLFSASIYTLLSALILRIPNGRAYAPLRPKLIIWIFVTCDVIATCIQVGGAAGIGVSQTNNKDPTMANNILLGGLAFQVAAFFLFEVLLAIFLFRARNTIRGRPDRKEGLPVSSHEQSVQQERVSIWFIVAMVVASVLVYLRTCFRLAETAQGIFGELTSNEVYFGCLEFMPVIVAVYLFNIWHPGRCIGPGNRLAA